MDENELNEKDEKLFYEIMDVNQREEEHESRTEKRQDINQNINQNINQEIYGDINRNTYYKRKNKKEKPKSSTFSKHALYGLIVLVLICGVALVSGILGGFVATQFVPNDQNSSVIYESVTVPIIEKGSIPEIVLMTQDSVVQIETESIARSSIMRQYISTGAGSGVIITDSGYIVTNDHVVSGAKNIEVTLQNGTKYVAVTVSSDPIFDIAIIRIYPKENDLKPVVFGNSDNTIVGEEVIAVGNPLGEGGTVTNGIVSALEKQITINATNMTLIQTNAAINPGNSGGALFNMRGEFIGLVNAKTAGTGIEGIGFAIPSNTVKKIACDIINVGYVKNRTNLGVEIIEIDSFRDMFYYGVSEGVYIVNIVKDSDAERAGLQVRDRIISINGNKIENVASVRTEILSCSQGDNIEIIVERDGKRITVPVELTEYIPV